MHDYLGKRHQQSQCRGALSGVPTQSDGHPIEHLRQTQLRLRLMSVWPMPEVLGVPQSMCGLSSPALVFTHTLLPLQTGLKHGYLTKHALDLDAEVPLHSAVVRANRKARASSEENCY